ncbi:uncharacterized protein LOC103168593 isoform X1 [Ornithorhynchus anatinus]|uniref:uncharacterized protein LOC103168593 isoform X1 n=1 Tax=Ornithorhynchus anatinus TaxID=9258 RepID=UPI0010A8A682|nr:uncharacterized protein LOC103168593 isoform X1 [Ornithorhynchus anatinus]
MRLCLLGCLVAALIWEGAGIPLGRAPTREESKEQVKIKRLKHHRFHPSNRIPFQMRTVEQPLLQAFKRDWNSSEDFPICCDGSVDGPESRKEGGEAGRNSSTEDIYVIFGTFVDPAEEGTLERRSRCEGCCGERVTLGPESWRSQEEAGDVPGTGTTHMEKTGEMKVINLHDNINLTFPWPQALSRPFTQVWKKESDLCAGCCPDPRTHRSEVPADGEEGGVVGSSPGLASVQGPQNSWTRLGHLIRRIQVHYPNGSYQMYETYKLQMPLQTCLPCPTVREYNLTETKVFIVD